MIKKLRSIAIGGVVNFIMIKYFESVGIGGQFSGSQYSNNNQIAQVRLTVTPATSGSGPAIPKSNLFGRKGQDITFVIGPSIEDGRANGMARGYSTMVSSPAGHCNALFGSNPILNPEDSDTGTVGLVVTSGEHAG